MARKIALLSVLSFLCLFQQGFGAIFPVISYDGWDAIFLDSPSYLSFMAHSYSAEQLYVFGGDYLRVVTTGKDFSVMDHYYAVDWHQEFISLHVFHNGTDLWAMGPTNPSDYTAHPEGYDLPVAIAGPEYTTINVDGFKGYILYSVLVDDRNLNDVLAYMVGWIPISAGNASLNQVAFGLVRLHANINQPYANRNYTFDPTVDVLPLAYNTFSVYDPYFKPQLHYRNTTNTLIIVDPATDSIYTVAVGPGTYPMSAGIAQRAHVNGMYITSSFFFSDNNLLYVGYAASGWGNGSILAYSMSNIQVQHSVQFNGTLANPRAIAFDDSTNTLYVGFNGGDAVLKLDYVLDIQGWQRVPDYLYRMEAGRVGEGHIYFITNEQHSKVMRVRKEDFCPTLCPYNGYCKSGKCVCGPHFTLSSDKRSCNYPKAGKSDKGAAAALGVLFALSFVAAAGGWFMWWRARKGGYVSV